MWWYSTWDHLLICSIFAGISRFLIEKEMVLILKFWIIIAGVFLIYAIMVTIYVTLDIIISICYVFDKWVLKRRIWREGDEQERMNIQNKQTTIKKSQSRGN